MLGLEGGLSVAQSLEMCTLRVEKGSEIQFTIESRIFGRIFK